MPDSAAASDRFEHEPVMVNEIVELFRSVPRGVLIDATIGGGGHAAALLDAHAQLRIVGLDQDIDALEAARAHLDAFASRSTLVHARFDRLAETASAHIPAEQKVVGVLFDLGVSSPQLDRPERGFSHRGSGPLDMRMDRRQALSADTIVNTYAEADLASLIRRYGDERLAGRVARAIVAHRPISSTAELAEVIVESMPAAVRRTGRHPARKTFQAIRIEVNAEHAVLERALRQACDAIGEGGRVAVLSYHSGEDRIVKSLFRELTEASPVPPGFPVAPDAAPFSLCVRGSQGPSEDECTINRRARSARLRAIERCATAGNSS